MDVLTHFMASGGNFYLKWGQASKSNSQLRSPLKQVNENSHIWDDTENKNNQSKRNLSLNFMCYR